MKSIKRTLVIAPGTKDPVYLIAKKVMKPGTIITPMMIRARAHIGTGYVNKVVIIVGAKGNYNAFSVYTELKKLSSKIKFVVIDGWKWPVSKKDRMVVLPGYGIVETIRTVLF